MVKKDWNDINDEDSSLSSESQQGEVSIIKQKESTFSTSINKGSRLKNACDERSLIKLNKHSSKQVWLEITNSFYERADKVHQLLEADRQIIKIIRLKNVGWNVLVEKEVGKKLISEGYQKDNIFIKFIYSSKNQETKNEQKVIKGSKKVMYVQKNSKTSQSGKRSVSFHSEINTEQQIILREDKQDKTSKTKSKWMEKPKSLYIQKFKSQVSLDEIKYYKAAKTYQDLNQIKIELNFKEPPSKPIKKYVQKSEFIFLTDMKSQNILHSHNQKIEKIIEQKSKIEEKEEISKDVKDTVETINKKSCNIEVSEDESSDSLEKQLKKKKKKRNKKVNVPKIEKLENNPYSYFMK